MIQYEDFSIKIEPQREDVYPVIVLRSPAGEGRASFRLPFDPDDLGDILMDLGQTVRSSSQRTTRDAAPGATRTRPQQIGDQLFNALFAGPVRSLLDQSLGMIRERQKGLRIKLHIDPEDASLARLSSLPWELMYRKETRDFLNLSCYTPILRYLDVQVPYVPLTLEPPLRILVVISNPLDYAPLNLEHERAQIEKTWAQQENVEVSFLETPSISALQDRLERGPFHALHYMGHGGFDQRSGSGVLFLEDESGYGMPVDGRTLGVLLRDVPSLRLVFLNACETARVSGQVGLDPFAGVAAAIVMAGVPAVVAMQFPISDLAAIRFAGRFYPLVALGEPVDYAVAEGRRAIRVAESDTMEWATPILFIRAPDGVLFRVAEAHRTKRRRPQPPLLDKEMDQRLEQLYIAGLGAFWLEEWDHACHSFKEIVDEQPDYKDAAAKLEEAERKWHQDGLYREAQDARQAGNWTMVLTRLEELVAEDAGYRDTAALLDLARRQKRLADFYAQAQQLHHAGQWPAVVRIFDQILALEPGYPDPDELLATARREAAELERQAELNDLYRRAILEMDAGHWAQARPLLAQVQEREPGYREAERLLNRASAELERAEAERQRREQIATLYEQAQSLAQAGLWRPALAKIYEIQALDAEFGDPEGIADRARGEVEQEEAEARRQNELAALYAEAVRLLKAGLYQEALEKWGEVQALDPRYSDRKKVQATARKQLDELTRPRSQRRLPRWAWAVVGGVATIISVIVVVVVPLGGGSGGRIALVSGRDGNNEIYVMNADGSGQTRLTYSGASDWNPSWSPDGKHIAFTSDRYGDEEICVMNADGSEQSRLTYEPGNDNVPCWSPDGNRIAFVSEHSGNADIWVMNADGSDPVQLTHDQAAEDGPCWSPDGARIAFSSERDGDKEIYVMNANGTRVTRLTASTEDDWLPHWSPDGKRIVFGSYRDGNCEIYVMNVDGSNPTNLTNTPDVCEWLASWSPNGKQLAFVANRDGNQDIWVMNADGSSPVQRTHTSKDWLPAWGP